MDGAAGPPGDSAVGAAAEVELEIVVAVAHGALPEERLAGRGRKGAHDSSALKLPLHRAGSASIKPHEMLETANEREVSNQSTHTYLVFARRSWDPDRPVTVEYLGCGLVFVLLRCVTRSDSIGD